jgi:hypothetical protein
MGPFEWHRPSVNAVLRPGHCLAQHSLQPQPEPAQRGLNEWWRIAQRIAKPNAPDSKRMDVTCLISLINFIVSWRNSSMNHGLW